MSLLLLPLATGPGLPSPDEARDLLRTELDRPEYRPSLLERLRTWLSELFDAIFGGLGGASLPTWWILLILAGLGAALVALVVWIVLRGRRERGTVETDGVFGGRRRSAAGHRATAELALAEGRHDDAVVEAVRALAAGLIERALLADTPDLTVHELTLTAGSRFAGERDGLLRTGRAFDEVRYGDRHVDQRTAEEAVALERRISAARPGDTETGPVAAVPR